jgi:hypothetical protein
MLDPMMHHSNAAIHDRLAEVAAACTAVDGAGVYRACRVSRLSNALPQHPLPPVRSFPAVYQFIRPMLNCTKLRPVSGSLDVDV